MSKAVHVVVPMSAKAYVDITPTMTSNTSPEGYVASASSEVSVPRQAWCAFDSIESTDEEADRWHAAAGFPQWLMLKFPEAKTVTKFSIANCTTKHNGIDAFSLQGSNNGQTFDTLGTYNNPSDFGAVTEYTVENPGEYMYYRIYITSSHYANGSSKYAIIDQLRFYEDGGDTIVSTACYTPGMYGVIQGKTKEITKGYAVVSGLARLFYGEELLAYTGEYSVSKVTYEGKSCKLYTLKKAGTLTLKADALYWMCGGGASGIGGFTDEPDSHNGGRGGGGGYLKSGSLTTGAYTITIGAGADYDGKNGGTTKIVGASTLSAAGGKYTGAGGSGAGAGGTSPNATTAPTPGTGKGVSTYPFGLTSLKAHCAGGGGGISLIKYEDGTYYYGPGGDGGSNGGNGGTYKDGIKGGGMDVAGGIGGVYGGGNGAYCKYNGNVWTVNGGQGSFYGAGGGGVDYCYEWDESTGDYKASGYGHSVMGYQGVVYILIPR